MAEETSKEVSVEAVSVPVAVEKTHVVNAEKIVDGAYLVNTELYQKNSSEVDSSGDEKEVRTTKDGKTALIPQPSDDPADPLNWSWSKKHSVLVALTFSSLLTDWGMTWGTTLFEAQALDWNMTIVQISNSLSGGIFLQGPGGVLAVPLIQRYGRLPVLFWSQVLSCIVVIGAAVAPTYAGFTACRTLQGFFNTAPQVIGLTIIHDMFFFHERARKINFWAFSFLVGPYLGPFIAGFLIQKINWRQDFGVMAAFHGFAIILIVLFGDETLYDREEPKNNEIQATGILCKVQLLTGYAGFLAKGRPTLKTVFKDLIALSYLPQIVLPTACFLLVVYMWAIGITTTITQFVKPPPYLFSDTAVSLMYLAPMIGVLIAEAWGHFFNDWLCTSYIKKHGGHYKPENRLWGVWPAVLMAVGSLVLYGQTLEHSLSWVGIAFGWGMNSFAMLASTTAISAYFLDSFPGHAALVSSWLNFWRVVGGFVITYFNIKWVVHSGAAVAFGCQAAIVAASFSAVIAVQIWGAKWRVKYPAPAAEN